MVLVPFSPAWAEVHLEVTGTACRHAPAPNYVEPPGVEYRPGVDAAGNAVAQADISPPLRLPDRFIIPITQQLYTRLAASSGAAATSAPVYSQALLGVVAYDHGTLTFNGQPLDADGENAVSAICGQAEAR